MRIAHALQMPVLQQGGVEVLVRTLIADALPDDQIFLVSADAPSELEAAGWLDRLTGHLPIPAGEISKSWTRGLACWLKNQNIDVCHFHLAGTYDWNWKIRSVVDCPITTTARAGIVTVSTNHQAVCYFDRSVEPRPTWRRWAAAARVWPGKFHQISVVSWEASVSQHDLAVSRRYFPMFGRKLIQVYHSRLDATQPTTSAPASRTVLNVATLAFRKGQHLLVEAFAQIADDFPEWQLKLVGYHAEQACVERIHAVIRDGKLENRVQLCGPDPDPSGYYQDAEIYVQPSLLEGLGLSLQEAMFHGRACIGSTIGGIPELIDNPTVGVLFPAGDIAALANSLAQLMADPVQRTRLGTAARSSILERGMTRQAMSSNYRNLYLQAIHSQ
jgi:glycosyltransferase involved in cell wall biosynthesis